MWNHSLWHLHALFTAFNMSSLFNLNAFAFALYTLLAGGSFTFPQKGVKTPAYFERHQLALLLSTIYPLSDHGDRRRVATDASLQKPISASNSWRECSAYSPKMPGLELKQPPARETELLFMRASPNLTRRPRFWFPE